MKTIIIRETSLSLGGEEYFRKTKNRISECEKVIEIEEKEDSLLFRKYVNIFYGNCYIILRYSARTLLQSLCNRTFLDKATSTKVHKYPQFTRGKLLIETYDAI